MAYSAAFVLIVLAIYSVLTFLRVQNVNKDSTRLPQGLFIIIFAGLFLENIYFLYIGRLMTRQIDILLITAAVLGSVMVLEMVGTHKRSFCCCQGRSLSDRLLRGIALLAAFTVGLAGIAGASISLSKNHAAALNRNAKLETMRDYASANPDNFYFYDTQDFISATDDVFQVYDISRPLNAESLGNWNVGSPTYLKRNKMMSFTSAIEGLTQCDNVYFVTINEPRLVTTRTLKDHYNKKLVMVDQIQASNCTLYVYCVVDAD